MAHEIYIARHGATEWSKSGQHTSRTDLPLLPEGEEQARELAAKLAGIEFGLVLCSPLRRARETCELAGFGDVAEITEDLMEWDYGEYEGLTTPTIREANPSWSLWRDGCPGGEFPPQIGRRGARVVERVGGAGGGGGGGGSGLPLPRAPAGGGPAARWGEGGVPPGARFKLEAGSLGVL